MRPRDVNPEQKLTRAGGGERKFLIAAAEIKSSRSCFTVLLCSSHVYIYFFGLFFFEFRGLGRELAALPRASAAVPTAPQRANGALRHVQLSRAITVDDRWLIWSCCVE